MSVRGRILAAAILLLAVGGAWAQWGITRTAVATVPVTREEFRAIVEATGTLEAAVAFEVGPPSVQDFFQYNLSWMIPEGSRVKEGQPIARFDGTTIEERLREHQAAREKAVQEKEKEERNLELALRQLQLDLVKAEGELKKMEVELAVPEGLISSIEIEQLRLQRNLAQRRAEFLREKIEFEQELVRAKLELLDVKREFAEGKISYHEEALDKFTVKAPVSGLVIYIPKRNGDRWEIGEGVWMLAKIMKIADVTTLRVEAAVLEVDAAKIQVGQPAEVSVDAIPGLNLSSKVVEIGRIVHERSVQDPSKVFDAILPLDGLDTDALRPGMGVHVEIVTARLSGRLTLPLEAIRISPQGPYVEVSGGASPGPRSVTLGPRNRTRVVVESGLEEGERVVPPTAVPAAGQQGPEAAST